VIKNLGTSYYIKHTLKELIILKLLVNIPGYS